MRLNLDITNIYVEPEALNNRGKEIINKFPTSIVTLIDKKQQLPFDSVDIKKFANIKRTHLILRKKSKFIWKPNGRSSDFYGGDSSNGCVFSCLYCYQNRYNKHFYPSVIYTNIEECIDSIAKHAKKLPNKERNQVDPVYWTYDLACNLDPSADAFISDNLKDLISWFAQSNLKATFATKAVNWDMLNYNPQKHSRIRFSLMPQSISTQVDIGTDLIEKRLQAANEFLKADYEVHFNLSPVIVYPGALKEWKVLLEQMNEILSPEIKRQAACEIIFLTHNQQTHELNLQWNPKGEEYLWRPDIQENKISNNKQINIRYQYQLKAMLLNEFKQLLHTTCPWLRIRYAF